ncbi:M1 family metallopeptidase [Streptococcus sp. DD13]|uniref:M1 family metallopeptidase n=1 Tax=Streptococcus sp. DD13 TaxID=1777881 RepID=UPI000798F9DC|nr:M1 family metallopeptidase [Streptococcus sp. DD13]KXT77338.1 Lysyl aminopeptidase [Streptococcus sp. DD13]
MVGVKHYVERFVPERYTIFLEVNRELMAFSGLVRIQGEALSQRISLHQKELDVLAVRVGGTDRSFEMDPENEALHVELAEMGQVELEIVYAGKITDNMTGIYPSYYTLNGVKKNIISTQFESHFAREVFPSIDEPEAKAIFDLSIKFDAEDGDVALSNMPEINPEERKKTGVWTFDTTPRMSTYLLAFALGALHGKTARTKNGTLVGVYASQAQQLDTVDFSLDIAVRVIDFYEDYFQVPYPIPQSLHLALPDFSAGAMENWGLVTYREVYLLVDQNSTATSRQQVALVVAHELAHQWFGNLVTMKWWDDLWLNESFANMMEYVSVDAIEPSWNIFEDFQTSGVPAALARDATDGVQSVHVEVHHPDEINTLFDSAIVYAKGSRLMHMLRRWLGDADFAAGLKTYFERHQYHNTIGRDLWEALGQASGRDVARFMDSWLEQPGYPLVTLCVENGQLIARQEQFFIGEHEDKGRLWQIPLNANWEGLVDILTEREVVLGDYQELAEQNKGKGALRINTGNTAHYISYYQGALFEDLLGQLKELDATSKLQIVQERLLLAKSGRISFAELVALLPEFQGESSYLVVAALDDIIAELKSFLDEGSPAEKALKAGLRELLDPLYQKLGFEKVAGEADEVEKVRQIITRHLLWAEDPTVVEAASLLYERYQDAIEDIPAAQRGLVLTNQIRQKGSKVLLDQYIQAYTHTNDSSFRRQLAAALSNVHQEEQLSQLLVYLKDKDIVKPQDLSLWYTYLLNQSFAEETSWRWAQENWDWLEQTLGGDMSFDRFVTIPTAVFKTEKRLEEYKKFFEPKRDNLALSRNITMGIKAIAARVSLVDAQKARIEEALLDVKKV